MARQKSRLNIYILGIAIAVAAVMGYYLPSKRPDSGVTLTPKEYIELVEKKKQQRLHYEKEQRESEQQARDQAAEQATQNVPTSEYGQ